MLKTGCKNICRRGGEGEGGGVVEDEAQNLLCAQFYLWRNFSGHLCSDDLFLVTVFWSVSVPHFFTVNSFSTSGSAW